jgi:hypothetical protein
MEAEDIAATSEIAVELSAVIVAVTDDAPRVLTVPAARPALPSGPFEPRDRTIELGVRRWVRDQTRLELGYVEQLYTFGDRFRDPREGTGGPRILSIGYLALTREPVMNGERDAAWRDWYEFFPWEDWRAGRPRALDREIGPLLRRWMRAAEAIDERRRRRERIEAAFGLSTGSWNGDVVLERYELLYEAGLVAEALAGGGSRSGAPQLGEAMALDHRRILATAMGRLRGKIKYRPVIFELLAPTFTLSRLQRTAEALAGVPLHTGNFRRLVESAGLVEGTGYRTAATGGRPAEEFRFRREVVLERPAPGVRVPARAPSRRGEL